MNISVDANVTIVPRDVHAGQAEEHRVDVSQVYLRVLDGILPHPPGRFENEVHEISHLLELEVANVSRVQFEILEPEVMQLNVPHFAVGHIRLQRYVHVFNVKVNGQLASR